MFSIVSLKIYFKQIRIEWNWYDAFSKFLDGVLIL